MVKHDRAHNAMEFTFPAGDVLRISRETLFTIADEARQSFRAQTLITSPILILIGGDVMSEKFPGYDWSAVFFTCDTATGEPLSTWWRKQRIMIVGWAKGVTVIPDITQKEFIALRKRTAFGVGAEPQPAGIWQAGHI